MNRLMNTAAIVAFLMATALTGSAYADGSEGGDDGNPCHSNCGGTPTPVTINNTFKPTNSVDVYNSNTFKPTNTVNTAGTVGNITNTANGGAGGAGGQGGAGGLGGAGGNAKQNQKQSQTQANTQTNNQSLQNSNTATGGSATATGGAASSNSGGNTFSVSNPQQPVASAVVSPAALAGLASSECVLSDTQSVGAGLQLMQIGIAGAEGTGHTKPYWECNERAAMPYVAALASVHGIIHTKKHPNGVPAESVYEQMLADLSGVDMAMDEVAGNSGTQTSSTTVVPVTSVEPVKTAFIGPDSAPKVTKMLYADKNTK